MDDAFTGKGVFVPEQLEADARTYCFRHLSELGVTIDETLQQKRVYTRSRRKNGAQPQLSAFHRPQRDVRPAAAQV